MPAHEKILFGGGLNSDDAEYQFPPADAIVMHNVSVLNVESGKRGSVGFVPSNQLNSNSDTTLNAYAGNFTAIGQYEDKPNQCIYYILYNDAGNHLIVKYDRTKDTVTSNPITVLADNKNFYKNGEPIYAGLNFQNKIITAIAKVGDILYFSDNYNNLYKVNVTRQLLPASFKIANVFSPLLTDDVLTLIRRPPAYPVQVQKLTASSIGIVLVNNFIKDQAFQFGYRYIYLDNEQSVISPYSVVANYNYPLPVQVFDMIQVQIPYAEIIPVDVLQIDLCVRYGNTGTFFVVKSWTVAADLTAINQHNAGVQNLVFNFLNNQTGSPLDAAYSVKPFDIVPNICKALDAAKNQLFISDYVEGYNAPTKTSLALSLVPDTTTKTNLVGTWWQVSWKHNLNLHSDCILYAPTTTNPGYYFYPAYGYPDSAPGAFPATINLSDGQFAGTDFHSLVSFFVGGNFSGVSLRSFFSLPNTTTFNDVFTLNSNKTELKSNSAFQGGIVFYDRYLRNCGVLTNDTLKIMTPVWGFGTSNLFSGIQWTLSNANAVAEIPEFAVYYCVVRTKNLKYLSFLQAMAHTVAYYSGNGTTMPYQFYYGQYEPAPKYTGVAVDISQLNTNGLGYTFQKGDILNLFLPSIPNIFSPPPSLYVSMAVKGQYGQWVLCDLANLGSIGPGFGVGEGYTSAPAVIISGDGTGATATCAISAGKVISVTMTNQGENYTFATVSFSGGGGTGAIAAAIIIGTAISEIDIPLYVNNAFFEIQTPYYPSLKEPYYEVGNMYQVIDPGLTTRQYGVLQGVIGGDISLLTRTNADVNTTYITENMSPDDKFFLIWNTDIGRPNAVIQQPGQISNPYGIRFSEQFIENTAINGLSSFDLLNQVDVPAETGAVQKLVLTSKMQELGSIMLAIGTQNTVSLYLSETQVMQQQGDAFLSGTPSVIGTMNLLKGGFGTFNPESVIEHEGMVYWYCAYKSEIVRYDVNGLFPVSDYKLKSFLVSRTQAILSLIRAGATLNIIAGFDVRNDEYIISFPQVSQTPYNVLSDITLNTYTFPVSVSSSVLKPLTFYQVVVTVNGPTNATITYGSQAIITNTPVSGTYTIPYFKTGAGSQNVVFNTNPVVSGTVTFNEIMVSPYVLDDGQQKTIAFNTKINRWLRSYDVYPELFSVTNGLITCFLKGRLYIHSGYTNGTAPASPYNEFFGQLYPALLSKVVNPVVPLIKYIESIAVEGNQEPLYVHLRAYYTFNDSSPVYQSTDLVKGEFNWKEGVWYASFYRDRTTPGQSSYNQALQTGDKIRGQWGWLMLMFYPENINGIFNNLVLNSLDIGYIVSAGAKTMPDGS